MIVSFFFKIFISFQTQFFISAGPILAIDCHPSGKKFITCGQKAVSDFGAEIEIFIEKNWENLVKKCKNKESFLYIKDKWCLSVCLRHCPQRFWKEKRNWASGQNRTSVLWTTTAALNHSAMRAHSKVNDHVNEERPACSTAEGGGDRLVFYKQLHSVIDNFQKSPIVYCHLMLSLHHHLHFDQCCSLHFNFPRRNACKSSRCCGQWRKL